MTTHSPKRIDPSRAPVSPAQSKAPRAVPPGLALWGLAALIVVLGGIAYVAWQSGGHGGETPPAVLMPPPVIASPVSPPHVPSSSGAVASSPAVQSPTTGRADPFVPLVASGEGEPAASPLSPPAGVALVPPVSTGVPGSSGSISAPPGAGLIVSGIVGGAFKVAIVEREGETYIVRVGERVGSATVVGIAVDRVVLKQDGSMFTLALAPVSGVTSLATNVGPTAGTAPAPGTSGAGGTQTAPAGTGQPAQPAPGATTGAPPTPATAQPASAPGGSTPAPGTTPPATGATPPGSGGSTQTPSGSTTGTPGTGQGAPADQTPPPAPTFPPVVPSNTAQPPTPPVMPAGSTVFTPQPKGGTGAPRVP